MCHTGPDWRMPETVKDARCRAGGASHSQAMTGVQQQGAGNAACCGLLYRLLPVLIGAGYLLYPGHGSRHFEGTTDLQLLTTDGFQRMPHLLYHTQIGRLGQPVDSIHILMELGESRFCSF